MPEEDEETLGQHLWALGVSTFRGQEGQDELVSRDGLPYLKLTAKAPEKCSPLEKEIFHWNTLYF